jgi:predicted dehydrogenase
MKGPGGEESCMRYKRFIEQVKVKSFKQKKVAILGAGFMAKEYFKALSAFGIKDVLVVSRTERSAEEWKTNFGSECISGGFLGDNGLDRERYDLVIVATPVHVLKVAAEHAVKREQGNVLVEKPGSLYSSDLEEWARVLDRNEARVRIAFNRLTYPSFLQLKDIVEEEGGITSCRYMFTEWLHTINFKNNIEDVYRRWGIANSLHVISMAHALIGMPKTMTTYRSGKLDWHPVGERFSGSGVTDRDVLFSYHADWNSAGRWGVEIMTRKNAYRLIPLEKLFRCSKGSVNWEPVGFETAFPGIKEGVAEEVAVMLDAELETVVPLIGPAAAGDFVKLAESIFGYTPSC